MADERIRDELESERRKRRESRGLADTSEGAPDSTAPTSGDRITLYHRHPEGFGDDRIAEGRLVRFDETMIAIARDGRTLGVRPEELTAWEWNRRGP